MIDLQEYTNLIDNLQVGETRKMPHNGCSSSNAMRVYSGIDGVKFYCFKCQSYAFTKHEDSPAEYLRRKSILDVQTKLQRDVSYDLPLDFSQTIPLLGLSWLGKGGWTIHLINKYNIGYSSSLHRVILPIVYNCIHQGYTARAIEPWQEPKYLMKCQTNAMWESLDTASSAFQPGSCVVTEDILSAGRCGEFLKAYGVNGTSLGTAELGRLGEYSQVLLWLDNDRGGLTGLKSIVSRLSVLTNVRVLTSKVDPKCLSNKEIQEILK